MKIKSKFFDILNLQTEIALSISRQSEIFPFNKFYMKMDSNTTVGDYSVESLFDYQLELFEKACEGNIVIYLPTGSGKTRIATMLIRHMLSDTCKLLSEGGKRTFFLVNSVSLAYQQKKCIKKHVPDVKAYAGDIADIDLWDALEWREKLNQRKVFVVTSQILLNILNSGFVYMAEINLIVFDECHHANKDHPMRLIMEEHYKRADKENRPKILGLSATLIKGASIESVMLEIESLESCFHSKIETSTRELIPHVNEKSSNAMEYIYDVKPYKDSRVIPKSIFTFLQSVLKEVGWEMSKVLKANEEEAKERGEEADKWENMKDPTKKFYQELMNSLKCVKNHIESLGLFPGFVACTLHIMQYESMNEKPEYSHQLDVVHDYISQLRMEIMKFLKIELRQEASIVNFSSLKVIMLLEVLKEMTPESSCIVFAKKRMTCKIIYFILQCALACVEGLSHVKPSFILGCNASSPFKSFTPSTRKQNEKVLKEFRNKEINVLVASDVLEEGMDISACNIVVKFDLPDTYRSYVQSMGRARSRDSKYYVLNDGTYGDKTLKKGFDHYYENVQKYRAIKDMLLELMLERGCAEKMDESKEEKNANLVDADENGVYYTALARITSKSAVSLINRYCQTLPQDKYSALCAVWYKQKKGVIQKEGEKQVVNVALPLNAAIKGLIRGPECANLRDAKRQVALQVLKRLHELKAVDDRLLPLDQLKAGLINTLGFLPNYEEEEDKADLFAEEEGVMGKKGTKHNQRVFEFDVPKNLYESPVAGEECFGHVVILETNSTGDEYCAPSDLQRKIFFRSLLVPHRQLMFCTRKRMNWVC